MKQPSSTSNSKKSSVYLKRIAGFIGLVICMFLVAYLLVFYFEGITNDRSSTQKISMYQLEDFYALEENSLDILILGSSHAMCTYDPYVIEEMSSMTAYNLGTALQQPDTAYYLLREVYKTQKPKVIIYDAYFKVMQNERSLEQAETVLLEMKPSMNSFEFWLNNLPTENRITFLNNRVNPFGRLYSIFSNWESARKAVDEDRNPAYRGKGFYVTDSVVKDELLTKEKHPFPEEYVPFTERQKKYLTMLVELAHANGTQVIFTTAPMPPSILKHIDYYPQLNADFIGLAIENGVAYRDFCIDQLNRDLALTDKDFADQGHLNYNGAQKFNKFGIPIILSMIRAE